MAALHVCESHRRGIAKFTSQYVVKRNVPAGWAVITPTTATRSIMLATATTLNHMPSLTVWHRFTVATLSLYRRHLFTFWQIDLKRANEAWKKLKKKKLANEKEKWSKTWQAGSQRSRHDVHFGLQRWCSCCYCRWFNVVVAFILHLPVIACQAAIFIALNAMAGCCQFFYLLLLLL